MSDADLSEQQTELLEEIEADEPSDAASAAMERAFQAFTYATTLLVALASELRSAGDHDGADLVLEFSEEMAEHEARTL